MSVHMRKRLIKEACYLHKEPCEEKTIPWRELGKGEIEEFTEAGLMLQGSRLAADLTQQELADKLGVKQHHISEMEHGKRPIGKSMAHRLSEILGVNYRLFL